MRRLPVSPCTTSTTPPSQRFVTPDSRRAAAAATLAELRRRYLEASPELCARFAAHADRLAQAPHDVDALESLRADLHRVRGTAGSYGLDEASRILAALERRVREWLADPLASDAETRPRETLATVDQLRAAFGHDPPGNPHA